MSNLRASLAIGGEWLRTARSWIRSWIQSNVPRGSRIEWGSGETVKLTAKELEEFALEVAIAAVTEERRRNSYR